MYNQEGDKKMMGTPKRLPIVELEIDGEKRLYFADERLGQYRSVDGSLPAVIDEHEVDGSMAEVIEQFRVD
jgi:hypothetical protein